MNLLHRKEIFEKLRSRFGMPDEAGFAPKSAASFRTSAFPAVMLKSGLHECLGQGAGDWASLLGFAFSAASLTEEKRKPVFALRLRNSLQELGEIYGHGLHSFGLDSAQLITVSAKSEKELLWAAEEIVASGAARAAILALDGKEKLYGFTASRRLKLRTETSAAPIFVLRHWSLGGATAAHARWRVTRLPSAVNLKVPGAGLVGVPRLKAQLERGDGGLLKEWEIDCHASHGFGMASLLADRAPRTERRSRQAA
jgi:protein ImuA